MTETDKKVKTADELSEWDRDLTRDSGSQVLDGPVALLLYLLMRDHLPAGALASAAREAWKLHTEGKHGMATNGWLARYANWIAIRFLGSA